MASNEDEGTDTIKLRGVAQLARAPALGAGGRWFESSHPDHQASLVGSPTKKPRDCKFGLICLLKVVKERFQLFITYYLNRFGR